MKRRIWVTITTFLAFSSPLFSQQQWSLDSCIRYALEHNFTIAKRQLEVESNRIQLASSKMALVPSFAASVGQNFDIGRAPDETGVIDNQSQASTAFGIQMDMPLFEGLKNYNRIKSAKLSIMAAIYDLKETRENVELNVTASYLQALLYKEMLTVAEEQAAISRTQVSRIEELVKNGRSSEAELYNAKSALASDQYSVTEASNNLRLTLLELAQLLNLPLKESFDIAPLNDDDFENQLGISLNISNTLINGLNNRPGIKGLQNRIEMSNRDIKVAKSGWYPSLHLSASYGTGYYHILNSKDNNGIAPILPFGTQLDNNSRGMFSLSLVIPLFDRLSTYHQVQQSKLSMKTYEIQLEETKANLAKTIEQEYVNALAAKEKYFSAQSFMTAAEKAFEYEELKFNAGASTSFEYNDAKTKLEKAKSEVIQAKYSYMIRLKILDFYGKE